MGNFRSSCFQETSCEKPILTCVENLPNNDLNESGEPKCLHDSDQIMSIMKNEKLDDDIRLQ